jgi:hypothetical protein
MMVNIDSGKDGDPKATISLWFAIALFTTIVGVIFYIANIAGRLDALEKQIVDIKQDDSRVETSQATIIEKLVRIDERQNQMINRMDNISANLRAHVTGMEKNLPDRFRPTPQQGDQ